MGAKMKGIYKSFKYISQIFVVKEREMEIGYPTDVKHVAHIGWDGDSANAPSWMKEFKTASDFSASSLNNGGNRRNQSRWSSQDFDHSIGYQPMSEIFQDSPSTDSSRSLRKHKRKKTKSSSSLSSLKESSNSSRSSITSKSNAAYMATVADQLEAATSNLQEVFH